MSTNDLTERAKKAISARDFSPAMRQAIIDADVGIFGDALKLITQRQVRKALARRGFAERNAIGLTDMGVEAHRLLTDCSPRKDRADDSAISAMADVHAAQRRVGPGRPSLPARPRSERLPMTTPSPPSAMPAPRKTFGGGPDSGLMIFVGFMYANGDATMLNRTLIDMACEMPDPPLTQEEVSEMGHAAKMAMGKVLARRRKAAKKQGALR